jgi:phosphate-selective porin OprO/OprP
VVTGERASYRGVSPRSPFDPGAGGWGAVEVAVRYSELRVGDGAFPIFASPTTSAARARALAGGLNWYVNRSVKMVVDYEETRFRGGAINGNRPTERTLSTRLQLAF